MPVLSEPGRRLFRASDPSPYCYVLTEGPRRFLGWAFRAKSREDLDALATREGRKVEAIDAPGGGFQVRLQEPNGHAVDIVWGIAPAEPIAIERQLMNTGKAPLNRVGELFRLGTDATPVKRLAHVVIGAPDVRATVDWFLHTLGMISSDEVTAGPEKKTIGAFVRLDDGDEYVDHHTVFVIASERTGLHHVSFEAYDIDAVLAEHHRLTELGYEHAWGVGRHHLGSQIFDYWVDPNGYLHEHWTDSDRLNASTPTAVWDVSEGLKNQWGAESPPRVRNAVLA